MALTDVFKRLRIKAPEITYFNHLLGEFESLEAGAVGGVPAPGLPAPPADQAALPSTPTGEEDTKTEDDAGPVDGAAGPTAAGVAERRPAAAAGQAEARRKILAWARPRIKELVTKRNDETLEWNDLYLFEMILADVRPGGTLRSRLLSLRRDYRNVAGQVEYDEYLASKPKNLLDPPDPRDPPDADANYEALLRDDLKDLLGRLFKRYAVLPIREARLKRLTVWASLFCGLFLLILLWFIVSMPPEDGASAEGPDGAAETSTVLRQDSDAARRAAGSSAAAPRPAPQRRSRWPSIPLFVVLVSGAMGGFLSALQRIQSSPTEGDSMYNLSMLYHGSYAVFVAPLTGGIFAILLYLMFTGEILEGRFFPKIYTPPAVVAAATPTPTPSPAARPAAPQTNANLTQPTAADRRPDATAPARPAQPAPAASPNVTPAANVNANVNTDIGGNVNAAAGGVNVNTANANGAAAAHTNTNTVAAPTPTPRQVPTASLGVGDFLYRSGPAGGQDYALLIIWSFIAGFAERFVPDSLNRLIAGRQGGPAGA